MAFWSNYKCFVVCSRKPQICGNNSTPCGSERRQNFCVGCYETIGVEVCISYFKNGLMMRKLAMAKYGKHFKSLTQETKFLAILPQIVYQYVANYLLKRLRSTLKVYNMSNKRTIKYVYCIYNLARPLVYYSTLYIVIIIFLALILYIWLSIVDVNLA